MSDTHFVELLFGVALLIGYGLGLLCGLGIGRAQGKREAYRGLLKEAP